LARRPRNKNKKESETLMKIKTHTHVNIPIASWSLLPYKSTASPPPSLTPDNGYRTRVPQGRNKSPSPTLPHPDYSKKNPLPPLPPCRFSDIKPPEEKKTRLFWIFLADIAGSRHVYLLCKNYPPQHSSL